MIFLRLKIALYPSLFENNMNPTIDTDIIDDYKPDENIRC